MIEIIQEFYREHVLVSIILAGLIGFTSDWVWAMWSKTIADGRAFAAANYSFLIYICGFFYTMMIIGAENLLVVAYLIASYFGTYFAVKSKDNG